MFMKYNCIYGTFQQPKFRKIYNLPETVLRDYKANTKHTIPRRAEKVKLTIKSFTNSLYNVTEKFQDLLPEICCINTNLYLFNLIIVYFFDKVLRIDYSFVQRHVLISPSHIFYVAKFIFTV